MVFMAMKAIEIKDFIENIGRLSITTEQAIAMIEEAKK